jgi:hypothetical protein
MRLDGRVGPVNVCAHGPGAHLAERSSGRRVVVRATVLVLAC